jgi:putative toxin-antitoxin system antitoxin component (TIGR02293 family)
MTAHAVPACPDVVIASPVGLDPADRDGAFWQCAVDQAELSERQRLEAIEQGWSSRWLIALREHLHLRLAELESLLARSEAKLARGVRQAGPLDPAVSERLDRLLEAIGLALGVFEDPLASATWLKAPHPLLHQVSPLQHCRTAFGASQVRRLLQAMEQVATV